MMPMHPLGFALITASILVTSADDLLAGKMYFTDRGASLVRRANLDGTGLETIISAAGTNIRGIALDLERGQFFYADNGPGENPDSDIADFQILTSHCSEVYLRLIHEAKAKKLSAEGSPPQTERSPA